MILTAQVVLTLAVSIPSVRIGIVDQVPMVAYQDVIDAPYTRRLRHGALPQVVMCAGSDVAKTKRSVFRDKR